MLQAQDRLDQPGNAGRLIQVADIGLHRTDRTDTAPRRLLPKCPRQRFELDRVAQLRAGAMRLDIADGIGRSRLPPPAPRRSRASVHACSARCSRTFPRHRC